MGNNFYFKSEYDYDLIEYDFPFINNFSLLQEKHRSSGHEHAQIDHPFGAPSDTYTINKEPHDLAVSQPIQNPKLSSKTLEQLSGGSHLLDTSSIEVKQCKQNTASVSSPSDDDALPLELKLQLQQTCNAKDEETETINASEDASCYDDQSAVDAILEGNAAKQGKHEFFVYAQRMQSKSRVRFR